jgi:hypothetical protein
LSLQQDKSLIHGFQSQSPGKEGRMYEEEIVLKTERVGNTRNKQNGKG